MDLVGGSYKIEVPGINIVYLYSTRISHEHIINILSYRINTILPVSTTNPYISLSNVHLIVYLD